MAFLDGAPPERLCQPMVDYFTAKGGELHMNQRLKNIELNDDGSVKQLNMVNGQTVSISIGWWQRRVKGAAGTWRMLTWQRLRLHRGLCGRAAPAVHHASATGCVLVRGTSVRATGNAACGAFMSTAVIPIVTCATFAAILCFSLLVLHASAT
jgi:hypothetical protein